MAADMKQMIANSVKTLIIDKNKKRITVKDIVEECNITRQAFYYHFADIPELLRWISNQKAEELKNTLGKELTPEERIKCWFLVFLNAKKGIKKGAESNYGEEFVKIFVNQILRMFREILDESEISMDEFEKELVVRYHGYAAIGMLSSWTEEDSKNIDRVVHDVYLLLTGRIAEL